jgi:hypothetical protein
MSDTTRSIFSSRTIVEIADLPDPVRRIVHSDGFSDWSSTLIGDRIEKLSDDLYAVIFTYSRYRETYVLRCPTCLRWDWASLERAHKGRECPQCARYRENRKRHSLRVTGDERPGCRKVILKKRLSPWPSPEIWDGFSARDPESQTQRAFLSEGMKQQLGRMIIQGYFAVLENAGLPSQNGETR